MNIYEYCEREAQRWLPKMIREIKDELKENPDSPLKKFSYMVPEGFMFDMFHIKWYNELSDYVRSCYLTGEEKNLTNTMVLYWGLPV